MAITTGIREAAVLGLVAVLACAGAAGQPADTGRADVKQVGDRKAPDQKAGDKEVGGKQAADKKTAEKKAGDEKAETPACMHCGATCGLTPVCMCEAGTKKRPKTEFDTTCEPLCIPGCGTRGCTGCAGCTGGDPGPCACPGRVRFRKRLKNETTDEEVPTTVRTVRYVCDCCAGRQGPGCCDAGPRAEPPSWWMNLTWWWPRAAAR